MLLPSCCRLQDLIPRLNNVSGLPVVDANNRVIGVISRKVDICSVNLFFYEQLSLLADASLLPHQRAPRFWQASV
jgi:hypothetical protein